jgi:hypothetical protein
MTATLRRLTALRSQRGRGALARTGRSARGYPCNRHGYRPFRLGSRQADGAGARLVLTLGDSHGAGRIAVTGLIPGCSPQREPERAGWAAAGAAGWRSAMFTKLSPGE